MKIKKKAFFIDKKSVVYRIKMYICKVFIKIVIKIEN